MVAVRAVLPGATAIPLKPSSVGTITQSLALAQRGSVVRLQQRSQQPSTRRSPAPTAEQRGGRPKATLRRARNTQPKQRRATHLRLRLQARGGTCGEREQTS